MNVDRLAWSLAHSLWQDAAIALITAILLRVLAKWSAAHRYAVCLLSLLLMVVTPVVTLFFYDSFSRLSRASVSFFVQVIDPSVPFQAILDAGGDWTRWVVAIWLVGVAINVTRLLTNWHFTRVLIQTASEIVPSEVVAVFEAMKRELAFRRSVRLMVTDRVEGPAAIGLLKPVVLLPVTALTGLDPVELKAILAHELAHILRHDFALNVLQRSAESLLFYHPAVWWLSRRIRTEREHCCDDVALRLCRDRLAYAQALVKLEQVRSTASLAVAAAGSNLPDRVRRIMGRDTASAEWQPAAASSVFVIAVWIIAGMWNINSLGASPLPPMPPPPSYLEARAQAVPAPAVAPTSPTILQMALATLAGPRQEGSSSIEGTVLRSETNEPLGAAKVVLTKVFQAGSPPPSSATLLAGGPTTVTNAQGKFRLSDIPTESYRLVVILDGFSPQEYGSREAGRSGSGSVLNIRPGDALKDIVVRLSSTGSINGRVTNTAGRPQMGLDVTLFSLIYDANGSPLFRIASSAQTDDRGQYRLYWITPGDYYLTAGPSVMAAASIGAVARNQKQVTTYYPDVIDRAMAVMIQVKPGVDLGGIDVAVRQTPTYRVRGYVAGLPSSNLTLSIFPREPLPSSIVMAPQGIPAKADGSFELTDVAPGQYWVRAQVGTPRLFPSGMPPQADSASALVSVNVVSEDVENLVLSTQPLASLSGRVTLDGGPLSTNLKLSIGITSVVVRDLTTPSVPTSPLNADGTFDQAKILAGEYQWSIRGLPSTLYVKNARLGAADVLGRPLRLPSNPPDSLQIDLSDKGGQIEGVVKDDRQTPVARARVTLVPDINRDRRDLYKSVTADASGRFTFVGIPPGDYKLFAWEDVATNAFFNADFVRPFEARGKAVRINESAKLSLDVTVIRVGAQQ